MDAPLLAADDFIERTRELQQALDQELQQGRDRLLEINSCRPGAAEALIDEAMQRELDFNLFNFMERIYDCYGVNSEIRGHDGWVLTPGDNMLTQMPGLPDDGMTVTYDRSAALANEDLHYLTWEHPFVRNAMDMILSSEFGNTALIALQYGGVKAGTLLAECNFLMDFSDDSARHNERYFPNTSIRVIVDEGGQDHAARADLLAAMQQSQRVDQDTAIKIVKARQSELTQMLEGHEVDRLVALQKVNPGVRDAEIEFFKEQLGHFEKALEHARLRLDAVRVIVAI